MKLSTLATSLVVLPLTLAACGKSKVEQCNAFIDQAGKAQAAVNALNLDSDDPKVLQKSGESIDAAAKAFTAVEVKDEKLLGYRTAYAEILTGFSKVISELGAAQGEAADEAKAEAAATKTKKLVDDANALEKKESALVDEINVYCSGTK
jgi:hypothetical protein